jgi:hypothetical protein
LLGDEWHRVRIDRLFARFLQAALLLLARTTRLTRFLEAVVGLFHLLGFALLRFGRQAIDRFANIAAFRVA